MADGKPFEAGDYTPNIGPSRLSASIVMPLVFKLLGVPGSVLDVGCGTGAWLAACGDLGVAELVGLEGGNPSDDDLQIPADVIQRYDLRRPVDLGRRFDLTISVEVAEHIPVEATEVYLSTLAAHSDALLFSAAVPSQGGIHHVNERWPAYWFERISALGFECFDALRTSLWTDERVRWWYRQNLLLYARGTMSDRLRATGGNPGPPLAYVHPLLYESKLKGLPR